MLDIYEAIALFDIKANGRTSPLVIDCECTQENIRNRQTLLVKCLGLPEIDTTALYCELLGNLLAREVGIETPKPFIVSISEG